jgi:Predicted membrane protein
MKTASQGAYLSIALGFALAGSSVLPGKIVCGLPLFFAAASGAAIALLVLLPFALREKRPERGALRRALPLLCAQAFFGMALYRALMLLALRYASAGEVGMATSATPAITALIATFALRERMGPRRISGVALSVLGIALIESGANVARASSSGSSEGRLLGLALALGASASESAFNVLAKRLHPSIGPRLASAIVTALALAMLCALSALAGERIELGSIRPAEWAALLYQGVFVSALAYIFFYKGAARLPASSIGAFSSFIPITGLLVSVAFLGEGFGPRSVAGAAAALAGMLLCASAQGEPSAI